MFAYGFVTGGKKTSLEEALIVFVTYSSSLWSPLELLILHLYVLDSEYDCESSWKGLRRKNCIYSIHLVAKSYKARTQTTEYRVVVDGRILLFKYTYSVTTCGKSIYKRRGYVRVSCIDKRNDALLLKYRQDHSELLGEGVSDIEFSINNAILRRIHNSG